MICFNKLIVITGSFELALIRCCRVFDLPRNSVVFGNSLLPLEAFDGFSKLLLINNPKYLVLNPRLIFVEHTVLLQLFHPYRPVWYVPDQGLDYTILDT